MIAYPGSYTKNPAVVNLQTQYGQTCFDWGRQYDHAMHGINNLATASTTPPYWAYPVAVVGGPCNDPTQPCYTVHVQNGRYTMPSTIISADQPAASRASGTYSRHTSWSPAPTRSTPQQQPLGLHLA